MPEAIATLDSITARYRAILCDVWGVVHNGARAYADATAALARARANGLAVILITNAPRPHAAVEGQLAGLGVRRGGRYARRRRGVNQKCYPNHGKIGSGGSRCH